MRHERRMFALLRGAARFTAAAAPEGEQVMYLYDEISWFGVTAADFVAGLNEFDPARPLALHVSSPGGDVFEGLAMLNSLRAYKGKVTAYVDGLAASAASFLIMGADEVVMGRNSELMIHDAWGLCVGNAADMQYMAKQLERVSDNIADVYQGKAGGTVEEWRQAMRAESWYSAADAVAARLADRVQAADEDVPEEDEPDEPEALAYDLSRFGNRRPSVTVETKASTEPVPLPDAPLPVAPTPFDFAALLREALKEAA